MMGISTNKKKVRYSKSDQAVIEQMRRGNPDRRRRLTVRVEKKQCVNGLGGFRDDLKELESGVLPRTGGLRKEYLEKLTEKMTQEQMELLEFVWEEISPTGKP